MAISINDLDEDEIRFLKNQRIDLSDIYDGRRQSTGSWKISAKEGEYDFVLTRGRTCNGGHRLKTRAGHCPQCKTANIAFVRRENAKAYVYIASAQKGKIIKIGYAGDLYAREETLQEQGYGGHWDWEIIGSIKTKYAGKVEREISYLFCGHEISGEYVKDGLLQNATEMFKYEEKDGLKIFINYVKNELDLEVSIRKSRLK